MAAFNCKFCQDTGLLHDFDDDGADENGFPILREITLACTCPMGDRRECGVIERLADPAGRCE